MNQKLCWNLASICNWTAARLLDAEDWLNAIAARRNLHNLERSIRP